MQVSKQGWRKQEPGEVAPEKPRALRKMVEAVYGDPIDYRRLASDVQLPLFLTRSIVEAHAGKSDLEGKVKTGSSQLIEFKKQG